MLQFWTINRDVTWLNWQICFYELQFSWWTKPDHLSIVVRLVHNFSVEIAHIELKVLDIMLMLEEECKERSNRKGFASLQDKFPNLKHSIHHKVVHWHFKCEIEKS